MIRHKDIPNQNTSLFLVDRITFSSFVFIICLGIKRNPLKILCGALPSKRGVTAYLERFLLRNYDISFVCYEHLDLHGLNIPDVLIERFGELKDNINERSYSLCEKIFEQKIVPSWTYRNIASLCRHDERVNNLFKKTLLNRYCKSYAGLIECGQLLMGCCDSRFVKAYLLLCKDGFKVSGHYFRECIPSDIEVREIGRRWFSALNWLWGLAAAVAVSVHTFLQILQRLTFSSLPSPRPRTVWFSSGISYTFLTNFFKATSEHYTSTFHIQDALLLMEGPDSGKMSEFARENRMEMVDVRSVPVGWDYFLSEFLKNICCNVFLKQFFFVLLGEGDPVFRSTFHTYVTDKINYEVLARKYGVRLYLTARFYENNAVKTMTINKFGGQTIGFQFGDMAHPMTNIFINAYASVNHFFVYGKGLSDFRACGQVVDTFHAVGLERMDQYFRAKNDFEDLRAKYNPEKSFVITVFGPAYNETIPRHRNVLKFYKAVYASFMNVAARNVKLIIKVHKKSNMADGEKDFPELAALINLFKQHRNVLYYYYENPYDLMAISDMVITWSSSTTGLEAIAAGKPTVFMDPMKSRYLVYKNFHPSLVVGESEELQQLVSMAVDGALPVSREVYDDVVKKFCSPNDGRAFQRVLDILGEIYDQRSVIPEKPQ